MKLSVAARYYQVSDTTNTTEETDMIATTNHDWDATIEENHRHDAECGVSDFRLDAILNIPSDYPDED